MDDVKSLTHSKWRCKYHIVFATLICVGVQQIFDNPTKTRKAQTGAPTHDKKGGFAYPNHGKTPYPLEILPENSYFLVG